jgi:hypothetical protein
LPQMTDMAAAVRRCSLRRPQEDQTFPRIAVAPDRDLIAGYGVAIVPTAALGGIVVVGERDRCEQTISGNKGDAHADLAMPAATKGPNLRTNTEQLYIVLRPRTQDDRSSGKQSSPRKRHGAGSTKNAVQTNAQVLRVVQWPPAARDRPRRRLGGARVLENGSGSLSARVNARPGEGIRSAGTYSRHQVPVGRSRACTGPGTWTAS